MRTLIKDRRKSHEVDEDFENHIIYMGIGQGYMVQCLFCNMH